MAVLAKLEVAVPIRGAETVEAKRTKYKDNRQGFDTHPAIDYTVKVDRQISLSSYVEECLGAQDAAIFIADMGNRADFNSTVPRTNFASLFLDSTNKARNREYAEVGATTTQEEDFKGAGLAFANPTPAIVIAVTLMKEAREAGLDLKSEPSTWAQAQPTAVAKLGVEKIEFLTKLRIEYLRFGMMPRSGALVVGDDGRLRASGISDFSAAYSWALGGVSPAKKKEISGFLKPGLHFVRVKQSEETF